MFSRDSYVWNLLAAGIAFGLLVILVALAVFVGLLVSPLPP